MKSRVVKLDKALLKGGLVSFLIPFIVMLLGFYLREIAPFGERTLCSMDGFSQYWPMLQNMGEAIKSGEIMYSFNGASGFNLFAQSAYYTNSPFWILIYFLPESIKISGVNLLVVLKLCFSSLFFFLRLYFTHTEKTCYAKKLLFPCLSVAWGLSGYALAFINQLMWTDVVMLLPLTIWGLELLFRKGRPTLYILCLFLSVWSCFYLSYMVCIFAVLYFLYLTLKEGISLKAFLGKGTLFALSSILSAGMAAVVLIPTYKALSLTLASDLGFEGELEFTHGILEFITNFLPFVKPSLEYGAPNLYFGIGSILLLICALFSGKIKNSNKLLSAAFLIFMLISMNLNLGDFIWHGFHYPNQLPGRQSFLFIFLALSFAAAYVDLSAFKKGFVRFLCFLLLAELCLNGIMQTTTYIWASKSSSLNRYNSIMSEFVPLQEVDGFTRIEFADVKKNNGTQQYSFRGITYYSSTMTADAYNFFQAIGQPKYAKNVSVYYEQSEITNALFGISHILTEKKTRQKDGSDKYEFTITENKNALPLAFLCSDDIRNFVLTDHEPGKETQKALWLSLTEKDSEDFISQAKELQEKGMEISLFDTDRIKGNITAEKESVLFTTIPFDGGWKFYVDGEETEVIKLCDYFCSAIIPEGSHEIEFIYTVPGIAIGSVLSLISLAGVIILLQVTKKKKI